jgi:hypothetical protein
MINAVTLPPGGATLSFDTNQDTEQDFDFANVDISADGVNFTTLASFSGTFVGTRFINISGFAGGPIRVRFRMTSDLAVPAPGWYVENIRISSDDFRTIADLAPAATSLPITARTNGTYTYRVAALFANTGGEPSVTGPYSNLQCVTVTQPIAVTGVVSRKVHNGVAHDVALPLTSSVGIEPRSGGANGSYQVIFRFPGAVTVGSATATSESGGAGVAGAPVTSADGMEVTVNLTGVSNAQRLRVNLVGVNNGTNTGNVGVTLGVLTGDVNGDTVVNTGDTVQTRSRSGQVTDSTNFRNDVNLDGTINSGDTTVVRNNAGGGIAP